MGWPARGKSVYNSSEGSTEGCGSTYRLGRASLLVATAPMRPSAVAEWVLASTFLWLCPPKGRSQNGSPVAAVHRPRQPGACSRCATPRWNRLEQPCQARTTVQRHRAPVSQRLRVSSGPAASVQHYVMSNYYVLRGILNTRMSRNRVLTEWGGLDGLNWISGCGSVESCIVI